MRAIFALLSLTIVLTACAETNRGVGKRMKDFGINPSSLNPRNWFGRSEEEKVADPTPPGEERELSYAERTGDVRPLVEEVLDVTVEAVPGGALLRARGVSLMQGYWQPALKVSRDDSDNDTLAFRFIAMPPPEDLPVGTPESREILVAQFLSFEVIEGVRDIVVIARTNRRTVRR